MSKLIRLKNGAMQDPETGRIFSNQLESETAREMANKRWEKARQAVKEAFVAAHPDAATDADGYRFESCTAHWGPLAYLSFRKAQSNHGARSMRERYQAVIPWLEGMLHPC